MNRPVSLLEERLVDPPHQGALPDATGVGAVGNPACGDVLTLYIRAPNGRIEAASFESLGSIYQMATASVLCDCIQSQNLAEARARSPSCITEKLADLPENKRYLARLAIDALGRAISDHERREAGEEPEPHRVATPEEAEAFILHLLANGRQWGTVELDAMARVEHLRWPVPLARFLSQLREQGIIEGAMAGTSWRWWRGGATQRGGEPGGE